MIETIEEVEHPAADGLKPGWRVVRFGDVVREVKISVDPEQSGLERYVAGEHMTTDDLHIHQWGTVGDGYLGPAFHRKFVKGQVLYGSRRTYLRKIAVAKWDGICANTTFVLEPKSDELLPELLPFIMQTEPFTKHAVEQSRGSVNPYVNFRDIAWYEFALPPLDEQRRIADVLWAADEVTNRFRDLARNLSTLNSVLLAHLMQEGSNKWDEVRLGELMTGSPKSGHSAVPAGRTTGHYVLTLSALSRTGYKAEFLKPVELTPEVQGTKLKPNSLLISRSNTFELVGFAGIFDENRADVSFPDTMMLVEVDETKVNKRFLVRVLLSEQGRVQMQRIAAGTSASMKKINRVGLSSLKIPLPPMQTQQDILTQLDACTDCFNTTERKVASTRRLKNALTNHLLNHTLTSAPR